MQYSTLLIAALATQALAISCDGEVFDNYCCESGTFIGPVITSFSSSISSELASISSSLAAESSSEEALQSSLQASLSSKFSNSGTRTEAGAAAQITAKPRMAVEKRAVTTEVSSGLTCVGSTAFAVDFGTTDSSGSTTTGAAAFITQAPMLMAGAAAAFAYGAM
ncbi:uncharacterized protein PAC_04773 [Phialocephala subalpina]|uniref:GPI anchored protein n=1 Tax=Phialocephala subalpina TaxID=576137 RepID=A0A1L7WQ43_9HELO|nr:uncharacterized protein PAC_04773 [Phialocephala subalpina]